MAYLTRKSLLKLKREPGSHKGQNGLVLVVGGSEDYAGTLALAGVAAYKTGCDLVTIAAPRIAAYAVNFLSADLVTKKFPCKYFAARHVNGVVKLAKKADAVLIGNGITLRSKEFVKALARRLTKLGKPMVIDADGIKAISIADVDNAIITPHKLELEMLMKNSGVRTKKELVKKIRNNVLLIKGRVDEIISRTRTAYNRTGNASMTKAGTGDVLAGLCVGYISQTHKLFESACLAAYNNGRIGDELFKKYRYSWLASDMLARIKMILKPL